tara:strand:- start:12005 stop:15934 length:3930 start_codon:yes stop_codon:yes gene_type:complete
MKDGDATEPHPRSKSSSLGIELPDRDEIQKLFPELEIGDLLGAGGMGAVFKARQPRLKRDVAVKILSKRLASDPEFIARFEREAQAMAKLDHPNIVTIYDFGDREGYYYFIMEFVDGGDLHQLIAASKLDPAAVLELVPQICGAIQFAHEEGITHRDIKPANILLDTKGRVKIADFGLAKILAGTTDISLTMPGTAMGTPFYMAPEQLIDTENVDQRADIYSLGVVLYQMFTGVLPQGDFDPPSKTLPDIGSSVDNAVMRALAQDPALRFAEVKEMMEALELVREERKKRRSKKHKSSPGKDPSKRKSLIPWVVGTLLAVFIVAAIRIWMFPNKAESPMAVHSSAADFNHIVAPLVPQTRPGPLRGLLLTSEDEVQSMDLSEVSEFNDFIQVRTTNAGNPPTILGLRANGKVIGINTPENWEDGLALLNQGPPIRFLGRNVMSMQHLVAIDETGVARPLLPSHPAHQGFPANPGAEIADVRTFTDHSAMLTVDGRVLLWGPDFVGENKSWDMPPDTFRTGVEQIRVTENAIFLRYANGDVKGWGETGEISLPRAMRHDVKAISVNAFLLRALDSEGRVWSTSSESPNLLGNGGEFVATGVAALKDQPLGMIVYKKADSRRWELTSGSGPERWYGPFAAELERLGDIPGEAFNGGGHTTSETRFLVWIEPAVAEAKLEPVLPTMKPGRLRAMGTIGLDGRIVPASEGLPDVDDIVQIRTSKIGAMIALRANGKLVSNLEPFSEMIDAIAKFNRDHTARHLGYMYYSAHGLVAIDVLGVPRPVFPDHPTHSNFPQPDEPVVDVMGSNSGGVMLTESGRAIPWGLYYTREEDRWDMPPDDLLTNVEEVALGSYAFFVRKKSGEVVGWNGKQKILPPEEMRSGMQKIAMHFDSLAAIGPKGRFWRTHGVFRYTELFIKGEIEATNITNSNHGVGLLRTGTGIWQPTFDADRPLMSPLLEKVATLEDYPEDAFVMGGDDGSQSRFLFWIEPKTAEAATPQIDLPPALAAMKQHGGALSVWKSPGWGDKPYDISPAEGIGDFHALLAVSHSGWVAARHRGPSVSSLPWFHDLDGLDWASMESPTYGGTRDGTVLVSRGDGITGFQAAREELTDLVEAGHWILRSSTGEIRLVVPDLVTQAPGWKTMQRKLKTLYGVRAVSNQGTRNGGVILSDGSPLCWLYREEEPFVEPPEVARDLVELHACAGGWVALREDGRVIAWNYHGQTNRSHHLTPPGDLPPVTTLRSNNDLVAAQTADGSWRAWGGEPTNPEGLDDTEAILQFLNQEMGLAVDLGFCNPGTGGRVVIWIEPTGLTPK